LLAVTDTTAPELRRWDDSDLLVALRRCEQTAEFARRLGERDLYKRAVWAERPAVPDDLLAADHGEIRTVEGEIADSASVDPESVVLDVPAEPSMTESSSRVLVNGDVRRLGEQSTLVNAIRTAQRDQWRLGVYAPEADSERVGEAAIRELGLDLDGARIRDVRTGIHATLDEFN
jgi:HD superfamily phosphohydrolase